MSLFLTSYAGVPANRLNGNVVLATPPSIGFYSACCISVLASSALFLCLATYTRHETVIGWLVPHGGLIQVDASVGGTLSKILVKEGAFVRAGAPIARIRLASTLSSGQNAGTAAHEALSAEAAAIAADAAASEQKLLADAAEIGPKLADLKGEARQDQQQVALQVQQITIAREDLACALYREPKVLVLDEGTANIDPDTEGSIADLVAALRITRIVVAHRAALLARAGRVLLMRNGRLDEVVLQKLHAKA